MAKFKAGDRVKVVDNGAVYTRDNPKLEQALLLGARFISDATAPVHFNGVAVDYTVKAWRDNVDDSSEPILYGIRGRVNGELWRDYIVGESGLALVNPEPAFKFKVGDRVQLLWEAGIVYASPDLQKQLLPEFAITTFSQAPNMNITYVVHNMCRTSVGGLGDDVAVYLLRSDGSKVVYVVAEDSLSRVEKIATPMRKYDVNDYVRITDWGYYYPNNKDLAEQMHLVGWKRAAEPNHNADIRWRVAGAHLYNDKEGWIYGVTSDTQSFLIHEKGLEALPAKCSSSATHEFKVGQEVIFTNPGMCLSIASDIVDLFGAQYRPFWKFGEIPGKGAIGLVQASRTIATRGKEPIILYMVCDQTNTSYIMKLEGLAPAVHKLIAKPKFHVGDFVRVMDWCLCCAGDVRTAEELGLSYWVAPVESRLPLQSEDWCVMGVKECDGGYVYGIQSDGCTLPPQSFIMRESGLEAVGVTEYPYIGDTSEFAYACRLRFPNGEEVESPAPPEEDGWLQCAQQEFSWPARYMTETEAILLDNMSHLPGRVWWHEYRKRAIAEKAQILWLRQWGYTSQPPQKPETYQKAYEWL